MPVDCAACKPLPALGIASLHVVALHELGERGVLHGMGERQLDQILREDVLRRTICHDLGREGPRQVGAEDDARITMTERSALRTFLRHGYHGIEPWAGTDRL